jgi:hypothetical protein
MEFDEGNASVDEQVDADEWNKIWVLFSKTKKEQYL